MLQNLSRVVAQDKKFLNIINGRSDAALSQETITVLCPSDGRAFATIPASKADDVDRAVHAARQAFEHGPWSRMPAFERGRLLTRLGQLIRTARRRTRRARIA